MNLLPVLSRLAESAALALQADAATVCLLDDNGTHLSVAAVHGLPGAWLNRPPQEIESCALDREALARRFAVTDDARPGSRAERSGQDLRAELCVPLCHEGRPVGTLHVYSSRPKRFGENDATRLKPLADLGAAVIATARRVTELETLEARRAEFMRVTTHELRSPVTVSQSLVRSVLKGYAGELTAKQAEMFTRVSRRLDLLETLINDLLDLAAGKVPEPAKEGPVVLNVSVRRVMLLLQPRAEDKGLRIKLEPCRDQLVIRGTEEGLDRIFVNLVGNAIKYTPSGGAVTISVQPAGQQAQVEVADTGIGVPEDALPHLFEEFYRAPNAKALAEAGTGLGLAIVKDLVNRFGGHIQVRSDVGKGTTFTVTFPLLSAAQGGEQAI
jgi:signal transduction histidine kinase